jgi:hypothetical protein
VTAPLELANGDEIFVGSEVITFTVAFPEGSTEEDTAGEARPGRGRADVQGRSADPHS